jgi:hypothetical protein
LPRERHLLRTHLVVRSAMEADIVVKRAFDHLRFSFATDLRDLGLVFGESETYDQNLALALSLCHAFSCATLIPIYAYSRPAAIWN